MIVSGTLSREISTQKTKKKRTIPSVVASEPDWRSCICIELNVLRLGDEVFIEEWNTVPRIKIYCHKCISIIIHDYSVVKRWDGCSFIKKARQKWFGLWNYANSVIEAAKEGQQLVFGASVCQEIIWQSSLMRWMFSGAEMPGRIMSPGWCIGLEWMWQDLRFSTLKEGGQDLRRLFWV